MWCAYEQVCTLADMDYDVFHGTINAHSDGSATQEYYVKPRWGRPWDARAANKLAAMLEASIQRRFPKGLKLHVHSVDRFGSLATLTAVLRDAGLTINRAKVPAVTASPMHACFAHAYPSPAFSCRQCCLGTCVLVFTEPSSAPVPCELCLSCCPRSCRGRCL